MISLKQCPKCNEPIEIIKLKHEYTGFKVKIFVCNSCGWRKEKSESLKVDFDNDRVECGRPVWGSGFLGDFP